MKPAHEHIFRAEVRHNGSQLMTLDTETEASDWLVRTVRRLLPVAHPSILLQVSFFACVEMECNFESHGRKVIR